MKIRQGFVSNSSSSSFCLYGIHITDYKHKISWEYMEEFCEAYNLEYARGAEDIWIGLDPCAMDDNETMRMFKDKTKTRIAEAIKKLNEDGYEVDKTVEDCKFDCDVIYNS